MKHLHRWLKFVAGGECRRNLTREYKLWTQKVLVLVACRETSKINRHALTDGTLQADIVGDVQSFK